MIIHVGKTRNMAYTVCMNNSSNLDRVEIILCDTQDGANIGSVCRAMKTMGPPAIRSPRFRTTDAPAKDAYRTDIHSSTRR